MGKWDYFDYYRKYTPSKPLEAKDGIKAKSPGKLRGENWWAKRWNQTLEGFNLGARLARGRSYAKSGQVLSVEIKSGSVTARVQGSRVRPYKVTIKVKVLSAAEWDTVMAHLSREVIFAARLLAGEMPPEIEKVFEKAGVSLFPKRSNDLETECSCPDWSNPCKHIAAVYYILGQEFDRDPFLIFKLRGLDREGMTAKLAGSGGETAKNISAQKQMGCGESGTAGGAAENQALTLSSDPAVFWEGGELPADFLAGTALSPSRAALLKQLGDFPFWRGEASILKTLEPVYAKACEIGLHLAAGVGGEE